MSRERRTIGKQPTDCGICTLSGLRVLLLFSLDPVHIRILALKDFLFPLLHSIEEHLQAHGVDGTAFVEVPVYTTVKKDPV